MRLLRMLQFRDRQEVNYAGISGLAILIPERRRALHGLAGVDSLNEQRARYLDPHKHIY